MTCSLIILESQELSLFNFCLSFYGSILLPSLTSALSLSLCMNLSTNLFRCSLSRNMQTNQTKQYWHEDLYFKDNLVLSCIKHPNWHFPSIGFLVSVMFRGNNWGNDKRKRKKMEKTEPEPQVKQQKTLNNQNSWAPWTKLRTCHSLIKEYTIKL